ncbi:MAG: hypothetical protein KH135_06120 [Firmicutes bacterium]|nr:hypothetical protein [Bacillota bacterium]
MKESKEKDIREQARSKALQELKEYRQLLLERVNDNGAERGKAKTLGAHPSAGKNSSMLTPKEENEEYKWLTNGGFTSAVFLSFMTFVTTVCFFALSYLFYS